MLAMILDTKGTAAKVELDDMKFNQLKECLGVKAYLEDGTTRVIKEPPENMYFPMDAPVARHLKVYTKYGIATYGRRDALVWDIGFEADNGFSMPSRDVVEKCYVRRLNKYGEID